MSRFRRVKCPTLGDQSRGGLRARADVMDEVFELRVAPRVAGGLALRQEAHGGQLGVGREARVNDRLVGREFGRLAHPLARSIRDLLGHASGDPAVHGDRRRVGRRWRSAAGRCLASVSRAREYPIGTPGPPPRSGRQSWRLDGSTAPRRPPVRDDTEWDISTGDYGEFHSGANTSQSILAQRPC